MVGRDAGFGGFERGGDSVRTLRARATVGLRTAAFVILKVIKSARQHVWRLDLHYHLYTT